MGQSQAWSDIQMSVMSNLVIEDAMLKSGRSQAGQLISSWTVSIYHGKSFKLFTSTSGSCK